MNVGINNRASTINQIFVGVNNIARLVYQSGGGTPAFQLPEFTGNNAISGDETQGRIELYESGTLTLFPGTYDFFAVGGGASGVQTGSDGSTYKDSGAGGAGYTKTTTGVSVTNRTEFATVVGAGGTQSGKVMYNNAGGVSSATNNTTASVVVTANGGVGGYYGANGGAGGSGGGASYTGSSDNANGQPGGTDGGNGGGSTYLYGTAGTGQGTTTRMFGEADTTLYAGGGGGYAPGSGGTGGQGGGGNGGRDGAPNGASGTANTGGGGGAGYRSRSQSGNSGNGGSGIIIVRWNNT